MDRLACMTCLKHAFLSDSIQVDSPPQHMTLSAKLAADGRHVLVSQTGPEHAHLTWVDVTTSEASLLAEFAGTTQHPMLMRTAISPDCRCVAAADESNQIHVYHPESTASNEVVVNISLREGVTSCALDFSGDGKQLLSANSDGSISIWDVESGCLFNELLGHRGRVAAALFFVDGTGVISAGADGSVRLWQLSTGREIWREKSRSLADTALAVSGDGRYAAWGGRDHGITIWDLLHQRPKREILSSVAVTDLKFSPHGHSLAVAGFSSAIRIYNVETGQEQRVVDTDHE